MHTVHLALQFLQRVKIFEKVSIQTSYIIHGNVQLDHFLMTCKRFRRQTGYSVLPEMPNKLINW